MPKQFLKALAITSPSTLDVNRSPVCPIDNQPQDFQMRRGERGATETLHPEIAAS